MRHLGDITKISGYDVPIVDCVIGGSPCQDLSVAGLRKGLKHEANGDDETTRSGLFIEQIRIIKEMREHDKFEQLRGGRTDVNVRPRFAIWENVPGAFSSNKGDDFRVVLEEMARIAEEGVSIPRPEKKWSNAGCVIGDSWSIAWRVFDAQHWGVPQRRKRICLVADFNGHSAPEIVYNAEHIGCTDRTDTKSSVGNLGAASRSQVQPVSQGLPGNTEQGREERKESSTDSQGSIGTGYSSFTYQDRSVGFDVPVVFDARGNGDGDTALTITGDHQNRVTDYTSVVVQNAFRKQGHPRNSEEGQGWEEADTSDTLNQFDISETRVPTVVVSMDRETFNTGQNFAKTLGIREDGIQPTLVARGPGGGYVTE